MLRERGRRLLLAAVCLGFLAPLGVAPDARAQAGDSWCRGTFTNTDGHGTGSCTLQFQGLPVGVGGDYTAASGSDPAEIHVELFAVLADGSKRSLVECVVSKSANRKGSASCANQRNEARVPVTLAEPVPTAIVGLLCEAHSHSTVRSETAGAGTFTCWSTLEAKEMAG